MLAVDLDDSEDYVKALLYGNPKQGKTTAAAGLAKLGPLAVVDMEAAGWTKRALVKRGIPVENIKVFRPRSFEELQQAYREIHGMLDDGVRLAGVVVDHMTEIEAILLKEAAQARIEKSRRKLMQSGGDQAVKQAAMNELNPFHNELQDYGVWTNQARHLTRQFRDLPCHVAFVAHFRTERGVRVPSLTEKFRVDLMGSMNMVIGCTTMEAAGQLAYVGVTKEVEGWQGGDRFDVTKPIIANPSMDRLVAAVNGDLDFDTDEQQQALKAALTA